MTAVLIDWTKFPPAVIEILLRDFNTGKKIFDGDIANVIPRALKSDDEKSARTRSNAEVFTPPHVVKFMVDAACDDSLIDSRWIEIACGEAPFITTRYDAESGEAIAVNERVGILDRKLRAIPANVDKLTEATKAVQSVYGYELQGDSLLIARANVLLTVAEFVENITADELSAVAEIVSRNFWLMDGLNVPDAQFSLFTNKPDCRIVDWRTGDEFFFTGGNAMKFDILISNPPYQEIKDDNGRQPPIYHYFMQEAPKVAEKSVLITPARFLFNAGQTPKDFNRRMLNDPHLKVLHYEPNAGKLFRNAVEIKGGVVVTLYDTTKNFGAIGMFTEFEELNSIHRKVCVDNTKFRSLKEIVRTPVAYRLSEKFFAERADLIDRLQDAALRTNIFERLPEVFFDDKPNDGHEYVQILGRLNNQRVYKFVRRDYVTDDNLIARVKIFLNEANGTGAFGETLTEPFIADAGVGCTQTFITVGAFDSRDEAEACLTYIKSKFARAMLGILKATQHNPPATWAKVPLQDFSASSDIDWRVPVDEQLYRKYGLSDAEIDFIESHVKAMD